MLLSPALAITADTIAKIAIHLFLEMRGAMDEKYSPHEERSPTAVLKQAMRKIAAIRYLPTVGDIHQAAAERMSAPVFASGAKAFAFIPITARSA